MPAKIQVLGAPELIERFRALNAVQATQYIETAIQSGAEVLADSLHRAARKNTGRLDNAIHVETVSTTRAKVVKGVFIGPEGFYWVYLEAGTKRMEPHPFVKQSYRNRRSTARQTIRDTFRDMLLGFFD